MRRIEDQQTLAITVASVLFFLGTSLAPAAPVPPPDHLAWQLYQEGDWHHARVEALRQALMNDTDLAFNQAIVMLAAQRLTPSQTNEELQAWLTTNRDHPQHHWVAAQVTEIQAHANTPPDKPRLMGRIAAIVIGFYRNQIAPAIGQRCAMYPSCSHYSLEACRRYGLAGIPMTADRLIRESDHIRYRINPIERNGRELYRDPVTDHSQWFRRYRK